METYLEFLKTSKIEQGDTVYLISDITKLGIEAHNRGEKIDLDRILDTFLEMTGADGNLLVPVFTWDFCQGKGFDIVNTRSKCGSLTEAARRRSDFRRTSHPMYSFMVNGKDADYLCSLDNVNSWGEGTIFEWMGQKDAKCVMLGLPTLYGFTGTHHMEQMIGVPYRYDKTFTGPYTDADGITSERSYTMYVRDTDINATAIKSRPIGQILEQLGAAKVSHFGQIPMSVFKVNDAYEIERMDLTYNQARNMYTYPNRNPYDC